MLLWYYMVDIRHK